MGRLVRRSPAAWGEAPGLVRGMVRLVATVSCTLGGSPRPCAGDGSASCYSLLHPGGKPPALCRGWFGWLLQSPAPWGEAPGLVPGMVRLVATASPPAGGSARPWARVG